MVSSQTGDFVNKTCDDESVPPLPSPLKWPRVLSDAQAKAKTVRSLHQLHAKHATLTFTQHHP